MAGPYLRAIYTSGVEPRQVLSLDPHPKEDPNDLADSIRSPVHLIAERTALGKCPPAKVVQVLEAVDLLLAFELFVVVVAGFPPSERARATTELAPAKLDGG